MSINDIGIKKLYYSIGEVCKLTGLKSYVLRYWETEFKELKPPKNRAGNRTYRKKDIDIIDTIKDLLYNQKFTIDGARKQLTTILNSDDSTAQPAQDQQSSNKNTAVLLEIRDQLKSILDLINS